MTPEESREQIAPYLAGELVESERAAFETQLGASAALRAETAELKRLWENLALLPKEQPSVRLRARFYQDLNALERERSKSMQREQSGRGVQGLRQGWAWWPQLAAGLLLFAAGVTLGQFRLDQKTQSEEMGRMTSQVQNLRELVALSLLERPSANSRMEGVSYSSSLKQPNEQMLAALLQALNHDANVNVRLSSVSALERFSKDGAIGKALVDAIDQQDSPLVQIALIDALVDSKNRAAERELQRLSAEANVNPAVRQRAQWGLDKLRYE